MSKKHVIEVQAPEGKIPVYDESTRTISFIDEDIKTRVRTVEDAFEVLEEEYPNWLNSAPYSVRKMYELQTVSRALNRGHNFSLTEEYGIHGFVSMYKVNCLTVKRRMSSQNSHQKEKDTICLAATLITAVLLALVPSILMMGSAVPMPVWAVLPVRMKKLHCM